MGKLICRTSCREKRARTWSFGEHGSFSDVTSLRPVLHLPRAADQVSQDVEEATAQAITTWDREAVFHISSPIDGWNGAQPRRHHDFISVRDFPHCWHGLTLTVEVEAKAKEVAVLKLMRQLADRAPEQN